jgi:hypothetical protein
MVVSLVGQVISTQQVLDKFYLAIYQEFQAFAPASDWARHFVPEHLVVEFQSIECGFSTGTRRLSEVRLFNQVISRRYQAQSITHSVQVEIRRTAVKPGQTAIE